MQVEKAIIGGKRPYIPILVTRKGLVNNPCMHTNEDSMHLFSSVYKGGAIQGKSFVQFHPLFGNHDEIKNPCPLPTLESNIGPMILVSNLAHFRFTFYQSPFESQNTPVLPVSRNF